jgi:F0F1-type ATP synthase membrane subunit b/b'
MLSFFTDLLIFTIGYVAAIYTWEAVRPLLQSRENEVQALQDAASKLLARAKALLDKVS